MESFTDSFEQLGYGSAFKETLCTMLEETQLFGAFSRPEVELLADFVHAYRARKGTTIFSEGKRDSFLCILVDGKLEVLKETDGSQRRLATIRAGKTVGEMSIIDEQPHSATVVAATEVDLLLLTQNNLQRIADEHPRLGYKVLWRIAQQLSSRLRQTSGQLVDRLE